MYVLYGVLQEVWTLCRIFKRIPSYKKYTPNLKDSAPPPLLMTNKPNPTSNSSCSKTCSLESDNSKPYLTFTDSASVVFQQNEIERKPFIINGQVDQRNHIFLSQLGNVAQAPTTLSNYPSFWNQSVDNDDAFGNYENWDDLRSVVQFAIDPSKVNYDCKDQFNRF